MSRRRRARAVADNIPTLPLDVVTMIARCNLGAAAVLCRVCRTYYRTVRPVITSSFYSPIGEYEIRRHLRRKVDSYAREQRTDDGRRSTFCLPVVYRFVTMSQRMCSYHVVQLDEANMKSPELINVVHVVTYAVLNGEGSSVTSRSKRVQMEGVLFSGVVEVIMGVVGSARGDTVLPHVGSIEEMLDRRYGPDRRLYLGDYVRRVVSRLVVTPLMRRVLDIEDGHHGRMVEALVMTPHTDSELLRTCLRISILGIWCSDVEESNTSWFIWPDWHTPLATTLTTGSAKVRISILAGANALITCMNLVRDSNPP